MKRQDLFFDDFCSAQGTRQYAALQQALVPLFAGETNEIAVLANLAAVLHEAYRFFWVGFYRVTGKELLLGPFQGPLACMRIAYGKGVCGEAWAQKKTLIVPDVSAFPGHIACNPKSASELVIPYLREGEVKLLLDVDSEKKDHFSEADATGLARLLAVCLAEVPFA